MHNLKDLRDNIDTFKKKIQNRNVDFDINDFIEKYRMDKLRR